MKVPDISPATRAKLFALFVQGTDCVEIARLNQGITLGQIVKIRIEDGWDEKRREHIQSLLTEVRTRIQQSTLESVEFVSNMLAAAHKQYGDQLKKYIQSGDPTDLGPFSIHGLRQYREAIQLLKELTGQDEKKSKHTGTITHHHIVEDPVPVNRPLNNVEARDVVRAALAARNEPK